MPNKADELRDARLHLRVLQDRRLHYARVARDSEAEHGARERSQLPVIDEEIAIVEREIARLSA